MAKKINIITKKTNLYYHSYSHTYFPATESIFHRQAAMGNEKQSREPNLLEDNSGLGPWSCTKTVAGRNGICGSCY